MIKSVFLFLLLGCAKNNKVINPLSFVIPPVEQLDSTNCIDDLKEKMEAATCQSVRFSKTSEYDILLMCENDRGVEKNYWNANVFRLSYSNLAYSQDDQKLIDMHTICIDDLWRVEMYPVGNEI